MNKYFKRKNTLNHYLAACEEMDKANDKRAEEQEEIINRQLREINHLQKLATERLASETRLLEIIERLFDEHEKDSAYIIRLKEELKELDTYITVTRDKKQKTKHRLLTPAPLYIPPERVLLFDDVCTTPTYSGPWLPYDIHDKYHPLLEK